MGRIPRTYSASGIYHVFFKGINSQNLFEENSDFEQFKQSMGILKNDMGFQIYAYCLMNNHVHIVIKEKNEKEISLIMKRLLTKYCMWYNNKYQRTGALIAQRYKSIPVETDEYFVQLIRYIHQNPIKAGLVQNLAYYKHSSFYEYVNTPKLVDVDFVFEMLPREEFTEFHQHMTEMEFGVSDAKRKTDDEAFDIINRKFNIRTPREIALYEKDKKYAILKELKKDFTIRQLQRLTGVSRELIAKL